jgi:uncharacterized protein
LLNPTRFWKLRLLTGKFVFSRRHSRRARAIPIFFPLTLLLILFSAGCSWFQHEPAAGVDPARVEQELRKAVEESGGTEVWIKTPAPRRPKTSSPRPGKAATEVLAARESFDRVLAAAKAAASREGLQSRVNWRHTGSGERAAEVRITLGKQLVTEWNFREVPRILYAAIIIDDLGQDLNAARRLLELPYPLTFSVLPELQHSAATAEEAYRNGREVMLHLPMEPEPGAPASPGPGEIKVGMTDDEVARLVRADLSSVPHVRGVNNHMGSRATADVALMAAVMRVLAERRLFFVDSRTTAATTALSVARHAGVPAFYRSVFLDDTETVAYSLGQLRQFRRIVEENGAAVAIGHPHPTTISALAQFLPELERDGIQLVAASDLVRLPEVARLSPPHVAQASHP